MNSKIDDRNVKGIGSEDIGGCDGVSVDMPSCFVVAL